MTALSSRLLTTGIGLESAYGTSVTPTYLLPLLTVGMDDPVVVAMDSAWRAQPGDMFGAVVTTTESTVQMQGNVHPDTVGFPVMGVLGDYATAPSGYTVAFSQLNTYPMQPPSYTVTTSDPGSTVARPGCKYSDLTVKTDGRGFITFSATARGLAGVTASTPSYGGTPASPLVGWRRVVTLGGVTAPSLDYTISFTRDIKAKRNTDGSQAPYNQRSGVLRVTGTLDVLLTDDTLRQDLLTGASSSLSMTCVQGTQKMLIRCSNIRFTKAVKDYSGGYAVMRLSWAAIDNTTDSGASGGLSPVLVALNNSVSPTGVYK